MTTHLRRLAMALIAGSLLVTVGSVGALAQGQSGNADEEIRIIDEEITIQDGLVTISDTTIRGSNLPDVHVDHRKAVVEESTIRFDGFHITAFEKDITFCRIVVHVDDVGLVLEDVGTVNTGG